MGPRHQDAGPALTGEWEEDTARMRTRRESGEERASDEASLRHAKRRMRETTPKGEIAFG
jgi:hypothetical protein